MPEAIILCGGASLRLKPHIPTPKPLLKLNNETLIDRQIRWLQKHGFKRIILASDRENLTYYPVIYSLEKTRLGTGGAIKKAESLIKEDKVYVLNVDDLVWYDPNIMMGQCDHAVILLSRARARFGRVKTKGNLVMSYEQKPILPFYVSAGHYCFKRKVIQEYFPMIGDFENSMMPQLADKKMLKCFKYEGTWITINTMKDLAEAHKYLSSFEKEWI